MCLLSCCRHDGGIAVKRKEHHMNQEILLVEDEDSLNRAISLKLSKEGYTVFAASTIQEATALYAKHSVPLIICDIGLPDGSGLDFCQSIRDNSNVMFLFLTAMDAESDIINGYEAGADDYITKPFSLAVLISKVNAVMKRYVTKKGNRRIRSGNITWLVDENRTQKNGAYITLTANEQKLLARFMQNPMRILSKNQLLEAIWDMNGSYVDDNTVAVNIRRLREKIEDDPSHPCLIKNVRGLGYIWQKECEKL